VRVYIVEANAKYYRVDGGELGTQITKRAGFGGATGSVVFRIEVENDILACVVAKGDGGVCRLCFERECGGGVADIECKCHKNK
jgi:hypothetical protein